MTKEKVDKLNIKYEDTSNYIDPVVERINAGIKDRSEKFNKNLIDSLRKGTKAIDELTALAFGASKDEVTPNAEVKNEIKLKED